MPLQAGPKLKFTSTLGQIRLDTSLAKFSE